MEKIEGKCKICGRPTLYKFCEDCKTQVKEWYINAVAYSMDWMNIDYDTAVELGSYIISDIDCDKDSEEDAKATINWMHDNNIILGERTGDKVRTNV